MSAATETMSVVAIEDMEERLRCENWRVVDSEWKPPALPVVYVVEDRENEQH